MNEEKRIENKKADKKALKIFIPMLIASGVVGFMLGPISEKMEANLAEVIAEGIVRVLVVIAPYVNLIINTLAICICAMLIGNAKKKIKAWDGEDEAAYEKIDKRLTIILFVSNFVFILSYFFFAVAFEYTIASDEVSLAAQICCLIGFIETLVGNLLIQAKVVNITKELNPEKKGSVYAIDFTKQWEKSCDEAERMKIYKAAYGAYNFCNTFYVVLWLACLFGNEVWHFGIMPVAVVTIVWLANFISFYAYSAYYEKNPNKV